MNRSQILFNVFILGFFFAVLGFFSSCNKEVPPENKSPDIKITSPQHLEIFELGDTVLISVDANDPDGTIRDVQFYINGIKDSVLTSPPYSYEWSTIEEDAGIYKITVIAVDNNGLDGVDNVTVFLKDLGTVTDFDGNVYDWSRIGERRWMIENLKSTHYSDGTEIPFVESVFAWNNLNDTAKGYCYFENSSSNNEVYGALYNWAAVMNGESSSDNIPSGVQGVCPTGWHLPGDAEWKELEMFLGMTQVEADKIGWRGTIQGGKMKESGTEHWDSPNSGATDESGFAALPGGYRIYYGSFNELGSGAHFWSSTAFNSTHSWKRYLSTNNATVGRKMELKNSGYAVRCVQDY